VPLFRKKVTLKEFTSTVSLLHGQRYAGKSFQTLAQDVGISLKLEAAQLGSALMDWLVFGAYLARSSISGNCREDLSLRDSILDEFFDNTYSILKKAGMKELEFFDLEERHKATICAIRCIRK